MHTWKLIDTGAGIGAYNMSLDEKMLARSEETLPVLRFYTWNPPAVSLGRFQKAADAVNAEACKRRGIDIVRRITGGRAVLHHKELTYSIVARIDNPLFPAHVLGTYKVIAHALLAGLKNLGLPAEMVSRGGMHATLVKRKSENPACFSSPSWYEILVHGRKIIGSAQRRVSGAFLQHGSILLDHDSGLEAEVIPGGCSGDAVTCIRRELGREVPIEEVKQSFVKGFAQTLGIRFNT